jgi:hypothetical protein
VADNIEQLIQLRQSILENIVPLLDNDSLEPSERFTLYSRLAQAQGSIEYYQKAFDAARALGEEDKLQSFMALLDEVDFEIDNSNSASLTESTVAPEPTAAHEPIQEPVQVQPPVHAEAPEAPVHHQQHQQ